MKPVFDCKMCGYCCQGRGGIVISAKNLERAAAWLGMSGREFSARFAESRNGKLAIKSSSAGHCVFFMENKGCAIHPVKPDVCLAWPFFRGNLVDESSLALAKDYCPGIAKGASFAEFKKQGAEYLEKNGLFSNGEADAPNALFLVKKQ